MEIQLEEEKDLLENYCQYLYNKDNSTSTSTQTTYISNFKDEINNIDNLLNFDHYYSIQDVIIMNYNKLSDSIYNKDTIETVLKTGFENKVKENTSIKINNTNNNIENKIDNNNTDNNIDNNINNVDNVDNSLNNSFLNHENLFNSSLFEKDSNQVLINFNNNNISNKCINNYNNKYIDNSFDSNK